MALHRNDRQREEEQVLCARAKMASFVMEEEEVQALLKGASMEMLLPDLVAAAKKLARPPISHFYVGAVGLGASGRIFLGVNLEFVGLPLSNSVHAEQFLVANAAQHGEQTLRLVAVSAAPCGHCRQFLQELRDAPDLRILIADADAEACTLSHLLPRRFAPNDVIAGDFPLLLEPHDNGLATCPLSTLQDSTSHGTLESTQERSSLHDQPDGLAFDEIGFSANKQHKCSMHKSYLDSANCDGACLSSSSTKNLLAAALEAANGSHAPYTNSPSGVALLTKKGKIFSGSYMESVAHNPSLPPLQAALVALVARDGGSYEDIVEAILVEKKGAAVQFMDSAKLLLTKIARKCNFHVHYAS